MNKKNPTKRLRIDSQIVRNLSITEMGGVVGGALNKKSVYDSCYDACDTGCPITEPVSICIVSRLFCD